MNKRIEPIDGLRAFAVLGVLWVHIWSFFNHLQWNVGSVDINRLTSVIGNGVDLFFVISGFCMYVMYEKKSKDFSWSIYKGFLAKRFKRIAPAFYLLIIIECLHFFLTNGVFPYKTAAYHLLFINIFLPHNDFSPHYWSLATEWEFYLILPFLFFSGTGKKNVLLRTLVITGICLLFRLFLFNRYNQDLLSRVTVDSLAIWYRFVEFAVGIIAGKLYLENRKLPAILSGWHGFLLSFLIAYFGRICMLTEFVVKFKEYAFVVRSLAEPIMTLGFGLMIYGLITSESIFRRWICTGPILFIGKISYSMYLWHWIVAQAVSTWILKAVGSGVAGFYMAYVLSVIILIPVSWISYRLLEAPYFEKSRSPTMPATALAVAAEESI